MSKWKSLSRYVSEINCTKIASCDHDIKPKGQNNIHQVGWGSSLSQKLLFIGLSYKISLLWAFDSFLSYLVLLLTQAPHISLTQTKSVVPWPHSFKQENSFYIVLWQFDSKCVCAKGCVTNAVSNRFSLLENYANGNRLCSFSFHFVFSNSAHL